MQQTSSNFLFTFSNGKYNPANKKTKDWCKELGVKFLPQDEFEQFKLYHPEEIKVVGDQKEWEVFSTSFLSITHSPQGKNKWKGRFLDPLTGSRKGPTFMANSQPRLLQTMLEKMEEHFKLC